MKISDYEILTSNGFKSFDDIIDKGVKDGLHIKTVSSEIKVTYNHKFYIDNDFIYAKDLKVNDRLLVNNNLEKIISIEPIKNIHVFDIINVADGHHFTANNIEVSNCAWMPSNTFKEMCDALLPAQSGLGWKKNVFLSTPNGMNHFYDLVKGARERKKITVKDLNEVNEKILETKEVDGEYVVTLDKPSNNHGLFEVDWKVIPRYNKKGEKIESEEFKQDTIDKYGMVYFQQNFACVDGQTLIQVYDYISKEYLEVKVKVLDLLLKNCKNHYYIKTSNGYSSFSGIKETKVNEFLKIYYDNDTICVSSDHRFVVDGKEIFAKDLKLGDKLQTLDGYVTIFTIKKVHCKKVMYDILETDNHTYITNNIISHNCDFIGSSYTLVNQDILKEISSIEPSYIHCGKLNIYKEPIKEHKYIMGVDPAKSGLDAFAIQILDITKFPFEQVASAQLFNENFQIMPEFIYEWCNWYNHAFLIIENNEGAGTFIATLLRTEYEYENMYFDKVYNRASPLGKTNIEAGFRTTSKSRSLMLETFKLLMNNNQIKLYDKATIGELYTFVLKNNKFQADDGCHDDMIMSLCICLVPFLNTRNFEDMKELIKKMYSNSEEEIDLMDYLVVGDFDDGVDSNLDLVNGFEQFDHEYFIDKNTF